MTERETPTNARTPAPQELNRITSKLRELNAAYKSAVAANDNTQGDPAPDSKFYVADQAIDAIEDVLARKGILHDE